MTSAKSSVSWNRFSWMHKFKTLLLCSMLFLLILWILLLLFIVCYITSFDFVFFLDFDELNSAITRRGLLIPKNKIIANLLFLKTCWNWPLWILQSLEGGCWHLKTKLWQIYCSWKYVGIGPSQPTSSYFQ